MMGGGGLGYNRFRRQMTPGREWPGDNRVSLDFDSEIHPMLSPERGCVGLVRRLREEESNPRTGHLSQFHGLSG